MAVDVQPTPGPEDPRRGQSTGARSWTPGTTSDPQALIGLLGEVITELVSSVEAEQLLGQDDAVLVDTLQGFEQCRNRLSQVDHHLVHAVETTGVYSRLEYRTTAKMLHTCLRIPFGEAHARVRASHDLRAGYSMTGERLAPKYPHLAAASASGRVGVESDRYRVAVFGQD